MVLEYLYNDDIGKCYKVHNNLKPWSEAHAICNAEQSYLTIINNQKEADVVTKLIADTKLVSSSNSTKTPVIYLGFRKEGGQPWTTVRGKSVL